MEGEGEGGPVREVYSCARRGAQGQPGVGTEARSARRPLPGYATFLLVISGSVREGAGDYPETSWQGEWRRSDPSCEQIKTVGGWIGARSAGCGRAEGAGGRSLLEYWDCIGGWCEGDIGS